MPSRRSTGGPVPRRRSSSLSTAITSGVGSRKPRGPNDPPRQLRPLRTCRRSGYGPTADRYQRPDRPCRAARGTRRRISHAQAAMLTAAHSLGRRASRVACSLAHPPDQAGHGERRAHLDHTPGRRGQCRSFGLSAGRVGPILSVLNPPGGLVQRLGTAIRPPRRARLDTTTVRTPNPAPRPRCSQPVPIFDV